MHPGLETPRLALRPITAADAPAVQQLFPHWDIIKYFPTKVPWPYPADGAERYLQERVLPEMSKGIRHSWAITLRSDKQSALIGMIELTFATPYDQRSFWLAQEWQGLGFMSEATFFVNDYALPGLGMPDLLFTSADANTASNRLKELSGAVPIEHGEYDFHAGRLPITRWQLSDRAWMKARKAMWASLRRWNPADFTMPNQAISP
jgi:RimJ/RimL family protein N-acetyltransferase